MATTIYTLSDPANGEVRYIGKTVRSLYMRVKQHWSQRHSTSHVARWVKDLGRWPAINALAIVEDAMGAEVEIAAIALYRRLGYRLTNLTEGGQGNLGNKWSEERRKRYLGHKRGFKKGQQMTPGDRAKQIAMMKGNQFAKGHKVSPEVMAIRVRGIRRAAALRRSGLIIGDNWEAYTPTRNERREAAKRTA